ncbi:MAG TPA: hypothetical protein VGR57_04195 [Ktedonobacterales bacterium]|nr:hypothetical protein [Ktedonobacterales bacterium]
MGMVWRRIQALWRQTHADAWTQPVIGQMSRDAARYLDEVFGAFPYTVEAQTWLRANIALTVQDLTSMRGGGYWDPARNLVFLFTAQYEAAIHELAHAWWHTRRLGHEEALMQATITLSEERDPRYARLQGLAYGYIHGIPDQHWPGMLVDRNDWEMYAGLASGMMADLRLVPAYIRTFYEGMYRLLPDDAPSPAQIAPHG